MAAQVGTSPRVLREALARSALPFAPSIQLGFAADLLQTKRIARSCSKHVPPGSSGLISAGPSL